MCISHDFYCYGGYFFLQDSRSGKLALLIVEVPSDLPILLVPIPPTIVPSWNRRIDNYGYGIFCFANKNMEDNDTLLIFHDDNPCILKEIKSFLETNRYEIHFKWAIINSLLWIISKIKGRMVITLLNYIYITYHSIESSWTNYYHFQSCKLNWVGQLFLFSK
jgi:hypothetical protein